LWADGKFVTTPPPDLPDGVHALDRASVGNCVGHPMSPGVETSWNMRNPAMYSRPFQVRHRSDADYAQQGLNPSRDECEGGGCEPGDLTKRMSPPWQSDLYQCSIEWINFDNADANYTNPSGFPDPPAYQAYWWPPQAPMYVMSGAIAAAEQAQAGITAGQQVPFMRGLDNIARVVLFWQYLGFIVNENRDADRADYPTFVERERAHEKFAVTSVAVGQAVNQMAASGIFLTEDNYFAPMWSLKSDRDEVPSRGPVRDVGLSLHRGPDRASGGMRRRHRGR
jgi:L-lysine 6-oxidase